MKSAQLIWLFAALQFPYFLFSQNFQSRGIGGGGALFSPSINPGMGTENYLASDLGGLYHTTDGNYDVVHLTEAVTGQFGKVCFTQNNNIRYSLLYDGANFTTRPAKSTDAGITWNFLPGDDQPYEDKLFIFSQFDNPQLVIWTDYNNLYLSSDGGQTASLKYTAANSGAGILLSGAFFDGQKIWLGTNDGVLFSSNGGNNFAVASFSGIPNDEAIIGFGGAKSGNTTRFFALTGDPGNVYATSMGFEYWETIRGVYAMDNLSGNWQSKMNGIDITQDFAVWLGMADNDPNTCYLAGSTPNETAIVLKTHDGGSSWQHVFLTQNNQNIFTGYAGQNGDLGWSWGGNALGFAVNPHNSQQAILTDYGFMHQTTDGGQTWHQGYLSAADENPAGSPTPKKKKYHGIGLEQTTCWQVYWFDAQNMFGCFTDIKGVRSEDGGSTWSFDYTGHDQNTMYRIAKHNTQPLWFAATSSVHDIYQTTYVTDARLQPSYKAGKVLYTTDKGKTWATMHDFDNPVVWVTPDATNNDRLYASVISTNPSVGGVWRANGIANPATATWTKLPNPAANNGRIFNIHSLNDGTLVTTWSARKGNNNSVFSDSSGVFVSMDGGQNWQRRNHADMSYWTKDLVVDPNDPSQNTWYACVWSGWGGPSNDLGGLFRTTDRGMNWEKITGDGQFLRVSSVTFGSDGTYLTTETQGIWKAANADISTGQPQWQLVESYPFWHPERLFENPFDQSQLWVASFGNGMRVANLMQSKLEETGNSASPKMRLLQNPASRLIEIEADLPTNLSARFQLLNADGGTVKDFGRKELQAGNQHFGLNIGTVPSGTYFLQIKLDDGMETLKVVVEN